MEKLLREIPHQTNIVIVSSNRSGSTLLSTIIGDILDYKHFVLDDWRDGDLGLRDIIRKLSQSPVIFDELFHTSNLNRMTTQEWKETENIIQWDNCGLILKDHLEYYTNYVERTGVEDNPFTRLYKNYYRIKLVRRNLWRKTISDRIAQSTGIWGIQKRDYVRFSEDNYQKIYIEPKSFLNQLDQECIKIYNLLKFKPNHFHLTLDYDRDLRDADIPWISVQKSCQMPPYEQSVVNIDELWTIFLDWCAYTRDNRHHLYTVDSVGDMWLWNR